MNKEQIKNDYILPRLKQGEELIGFFQASYTPSMGWFFLIGHLMFFGMRIYYVAVTNQGLHLHKLSFFGKPENYNFFSYAEISKIKLGKGFLQAPLQLVFSNGRKLALKAQLKGVDKVAKLDDRTREFLLSKSS
jgi:hypothetical protein